MSNTVGGAEPIQGPGDSVNGRNQTMPAIPAVNGSVTQDHIRKPSMTVTPAGASGFSTNGGYGGPGKSMNLQFGSMNAAPSHPMDAPGTPSHQNSNLSVAQLNPRLNSPQGSPSPIPQPATVSGGRPPPNLQTQPSQINFGQHGGEMSDSNGMPRGLPQFGPTHEHMRRTSSQSMHGDPNNNPNLTPNHGRSGYPMGSGRGKSFQGSYGQQQNYSPGHNNYRHNPPRGGMQPGYPGRAQPLQYSGSPNLGTRSPAMINAVPSPQMNPMYMVPGMQAHPFHMGFTQGNIPIQPDPSIQAAYQQQMQNSGMHNQYGNFGQGSPRHFYPQSPYNTPMQNTYSNQGQPPSMSRQNSQMSVTDRPNSSLGYQQNAMNMTPPTGPAQTGSRQASVSAPKQEYIRPAKKSSALVIKNEAGEVVTFPKAAAPPTPASAAAAAATTAPPAGPSATPPNRAVTTVEKPAAEVKATPVKSEDEARRVKEEFARKIAESQEKERLEKEVAEKAEMEREAAQAAEHAAAEAKAKAEIAEREAQEAEARKAEAQKVAAEEQKEPSPAEEKEEPKSVAAAEPVVEQKATEDEIDYDALEAEYAAMEAEEARREEEYAKKQAAKKEAQKRKEEEEAARYEATLKEMERKAEEEEALREKEKDKETGSGDEAKKMFAALRSGGADTATPASDISPAQATPVESGTATPTSDLSMPPPARGAAAGKRPKIAELTLDTKKSTDPPEPSATLLSLGKARKLDDVSSITYPSGITPPSVASADRKLKYDKKFLLQFQKVFTEKPTLDWDARIRDTLGDPETSARAGGSARTPSGMGNRSTSNRVNPSAANAFAGPMGAFAGAPRPLPPGTTSEQRFAASNAALGRGAMPNNPFAQFGRPGQMGVPMNKAPSGNPLGALPGSSRVGGGASRGGSRAESKRNKQSAKQLAEENKSMPLTAGMNITTLETSATGWKPRSIGQAATAGPQPGGEGYMEADVVQRKVKAALNKMTPENLTRIGDQILDIAAQSKHESDGRTLRQVIQLTFEKATDEAHWAGMYAMFCRRMLESMSLDIKDENIKDKNGQVVAGGALFRKYLLNRCQEEFERGWKINLPKRKEGETEETAMLSDEYYVAAAAKRRGLGLVKFIGELFKLGMLTERIMHECVKKLVDYEGTPDEAEVESLVSLLRTIGRQLDDPESKAHGRMDVYFEKMNQAMVLPDLPSRLRFMLLDVIDLRRNNWVTKEADKGPTTIHEIHARAEQQAREAELQRLASQQANRGGGRMPLGRGDARSLSGYGQVPPPDTSNRVGTEDLRRLGNRNARNPNSATGPGSLGPPTLLGPRTNSNRRGLGPGSLLGRGDDSNSGSRSSTNPGQQKDKKDESSTNAFSALAALENDAPASPPSNPGSPPTQKLQANVERARSRSPGKAA